MKLHIDNQHFEGIVPDNRQDFKIATNAKLFGILSDGIYKDKVLAVIRELSCNAHDIHVQAGNKKPFRVYVPNRIEPTFAVEDEGTGIDPARIGDIFWTYGESSKTNSNTQIGALGLGSKSPFAYTKSSFVVKNRFNGKEHTYFCFINEKGVPTGSEVSVTPTDKPSGITVELAARSEDIAAFHVRLKSFFKYWSVKPEFIGADIKIDEPKKLFEGKDWFYEKRENVYGTHDSGNALAVMGNVPYPMDINSVPNPSAELRFIATNAFVITFALGDLSFQASREELSYEKVTIEALEKASKRVFNELKAVIKAEILKGVSTPLELTRRFKGMSKTLDEKLRNTHTLRGKQYAYFFTKSDTFALPNGEVFTAEKLAESKVTLTVNGASPLGVWVGNGYNSSGRWTLKQARTVGLRMVEQLPVEELDPLSGKMVKTSKTTEREHRRSVSWFRPSTRALAGSNPGTVSSLLAQGFAVEKTELTVSVDAYGRLAFDPANRDDDEVRFILNDFGPRGPIGMRAHAMKKRFSNTKTFFIDQDPKAKVADFGRAEVESLLKGTLLEGATVIELSKLPDFVMPKEADKVVAPKAPAEKGTTEVRMLTYNIHEGGNDIAIAGKSFEADSLSSSHRSEYVRIKNDAEGLYVLSDNGSFVGDDKAYLNNKPLISWMIRGKHFDKWLATETTKDRKGQDVSTKHLKLIARKQEDIDALIKKGAKLTRFSDVVKQVLANVKDLQDAWDVVHNAEAMTHSLDIDALENRETLKAVLKELEGKGTYLGTTLLAAYKVLADLRGSTNEKLIVNYALANYSHVIKRSDVNLGRAEILRRYPLLEAMSNISYVRDFSKRSQEKEIIARRVKHLASYIIQADADWKAEEAAAAVKPAAVAEKDAEKLAA